MDNQSAKEIGYTYMGLSATPYLALSGLALQKPLQLVVFSIISLILAYYFCKNFSLFNKTAPYKFHFVCSFLLWGVGVGVTVYLIKSGSDTIVALPISLLCILSSFHLLVNSKVARLFIDIHSRNKQIK